MNNRKFMGVMGGVVWSAVLVAGAWGQQKVSVTLSAGEEKVAAVAPGFMGVSYEMREILPRENGAYYFDENDENLVRVYRTLGITNIRVGANAVDDPKVGVPDVKEIDQLFKFARKVGAKVIYSFRLKNGDPDNAARLAKYIDEHYREVLDCYSIGNEPNFYMKTYGEFAPVWRPIYEAILKEVPGATFDGPATSSKNYSVEFADEFGPGGHLKMVSTHTYPLGNGREAEKNLPKALSQFLETDVVRHYKATYEKTVKVLADKGVAYRMDETNSCYHGGAEGCSDAYASSLWVLDYLNWWAGHGILGMNFHTGDTVNGIPPMKANYALFVHEEGRRTFEIRPVAYGMLAFSQVAKGRPMGVKVEGAEGVDFTAYGYGEGTNVSVVLINKSYGEKGKAVEVSIQGVSGAWERMEMGQKESDVGAKVGVELGGKGIGVDGGWGGKWEKVAGEMVVVKAASAVMLRGNAQN